MSAKRADLADVRRFYSQLLTAGAGDAGIRLERAFEALPREAFLPPGPWRILSMQARRYIDTPTADPVHLYQNVLIALDEERGINNGEPQLHAAWLAAVDPQPGERVSHIGAGTGYYTAILSFLTSPGGSTRAYEFHETLANTARTNLQPFEKVDVICGDATALPLEPSDVIYVNAGVVSPPAQWLEALRPGGRMIFPWKPTNDIGVAMLIRREEAGGLIAKSLGRAWFIPCVGASQGHSGDRSPTRSDVRAIRSVWLASDRKPDETAVAVYEDVWFSSAAAAE
ncbi:protein-L-isoaspartate O-methyltransferase family protein [Devosia nitrariae]|uniref:Protein-L-isoaspartate O-methyltransferase n=1 Tax=Devosia nitrariae TaxID=2071872 RepID=A0ABQ5WBB9_9HYPH|nr:protein-L-isoaspartate O-methyltransferase [Devosia nitrariae]GLQ57023.1 SAM-dependent methyltransferase [Devosia nitrariae]